MISTAAAFRTRPTCRSPCGGQPATHLSLSPSSAGDADGRIRAPLPNAHGRIAISLSRSSKPLVWRRADDVDAGISGAGARGRRRARHRRNLIPYIPKEEEKVALETAKILGRLGRGIERTGRGRLDLPRAAVLEVTVAVTVETDRPCDRRPRRGHAGVPAGLRDLTCRAPQHPILVTRPSVPSPASIGTPRRAWRPSRTPARGNPPCETAHYIALRTTPHGCGGVRCWWPSTSAGPAL